MENGQEGKKKLPNYFFLQYIHFSRFQSVTLLDDSSHLCYINRLAEDMAMGCEVLEVEKPLIFKFYRDW